MGGGSVSNTLGFLGNSGATNGEATVDGLGSQWINSGNLSVGNSGNGMLSVTNGGLVQTPNLIIGVNGQLLGDGNIVGNVQNAGVVSPGASPGTLHVAGNYTQTAAGELVIGLASTSSYDQLLVTGNISLAGTLRVPIEGFFVVSVDTTFNILDFATLSGTFSTINLPVLPGPLVWDTTRLYTDGVLVITGPPAAYGDFNDDGIVDGSDYVVWRKGLGTTYTQSDYDTCAHTLRPIRRQRIGCQCEFRCSRTDDASAYAVRGGWRVPSARPSRIESTIKSLTRETGQQWTVLKRPASLKNSSV